LAPINGAAHCAAAAIGKSGASPRRVARRNRCTIAARAGAQWMRRIIEHALTLDKAAGLGGAYRWLMRGA
jgi:hypothetical protein